MDSRWAQRIINRAGMYVLGDLCVQEQIEMAFSVTETKDLGKWQHNVWFGIIAAIFDFIRGLRKSTCRRISWHCEQGHQVVGYLFSCQFNSCLFLHRTHALHLTWEWFHVTGLHWVSLKSRQYKTRPGARFSKLPVITGPVKLFCFPFQMGVSERLKIVQ